MDGLDFQSHSHCHPLRAGTARAPSSKTIPPPKITDVFSATSDFVMHKPVVNCGEFCQTNGGRARQTGFRPAFHGNIGRFARRMRGEAGDGQIHSIQKTREPKCLAKKQAGEYQACKWQPKQTPPFESNICQQNKNSDHGADQKGARHKQADILTIRRCMDEQMTGADLAAQNIRDEWRN